MPGLRQAGILAQWDHGNRAKRIRLLTQLQDAFRDSTASDMERSLGPEAMLLFTRITAWLRLTYQLGYELAVQLDAIGLFLQSQRFLSYFMEVGGVQTVLDVQAIKDLRGDDKHAALLILIHIANSGRVHREMICDGAGIEALVQGLVREERQPILELYESLFTALGQGNPNKVGLVHGALVYVLQDGCEAAQLVAAEALRTLQTSKHSHRLSRDGTVIFPFISHLQSNRIVTSAGGEADRCQEHDLAAEKQGLGNSASGEQDRFLEALFHLLKSPNPKLRFEGTELIVMSARSDHLFTEIMKITLDILEEDPEPYIAPHNDEIPQRSYQQWQQASAARILGRLLITENIVEWQNFNPHLHVREDVAEMIAQRMAGPTLLQLFRRSDATDIETQRECASTIQCMVCSEARFPGMVEQMHSILGDDLFLMLKSGKTLDLEDLRLMHHYLSEPASPLPATPVTLGTILADDAPAI